MTTYYAAIKWPSGATNAEIARTLPNDLEIFAMGLIEQHGFTFDQVSDWFENAVSACEWCLSVSADAERDA